MLVDAAGTVVQVNEAFEVMFEAPRVRVVGRRLDELLAQAKANGVEILDAEGEPADDRDHTRLFRPWQRGRRSVGVIHRREAGGSAALWIRSTTQALRGGDGTITGAIASFSDVTALRTVDGRAPP